jgi:hypothetical protein
MRARLDLKPGHRTYYAKLGHCFKAVTLPYLLLIRMIYPSGETGMDSNTLAQLYKIY